MAEREFPVIEPFIDPFGKPLEGASREDRRYFLLDVHLTAAGHRAIADAALPVLESVATAQEQRRE